MHHRIDRRTALGAGLFAAGAALVGCAEEPDAGSASVTGGGSIPDELLAAAQEWAERDNAGKDLGGKIEIIGITAGPQGAVLERSFEPFEAATGVTVSYQGTHDANTIVSTRIQADDPPDVYYAGTSGGLHTYLDSGHLVDLYSFLDKGELEEVFPAQLLESMTVDGGLYGLYAELDSYVLWYDPKSYTGPTTFAAWDDLLSWAEEQAAGPSTAAPFCMALAQGSGTGAANTYLVENILLSRYGPEITQKFANGELPFTSDEVTWAFEQFVKIAAQDQMVAGGPSTALSTPTAQVGAAMFSDPPAGLLTHYGQFGQNVFMTANPAIVPGEDTGWMPFPDANAQGAQLTNGHVAYAMHDSPQVRAFMRYYASAEYQATLASAGEWTVANQKVPSDVLPNSVMQEIQAHAKKAEVTVLGSITRMEPVTLAAFYQAGVSLMTDPGSLESVLEKTENIRLGNR